MRPRTPESNHGKNQFRTLFLIGLILHVCAAWFNEGYFHPDEHFQVLEFGAYKLEQAPAADLAWEFNAKIRPAIQPALVFVIHRALHWVGGANPFFLAFIFRLLSALLGLTVATALCRQGIQHLKAAGSQTLLILSTFLFYANPLLHARFSSENWGGIFLFGGLVLLQIIADPPPGGARSLGVALGAGLAFGTAFWCRFQIGFSLVGIGLWLLLIRRIPWSNAAAILLGFLLACGSNLAIDHWFYNEWVLTPVRYFVTNIVAGKAAQFGIQPWYYYFLQLLALLIPPYSLLFLILIGGACIRFRQQLLVWAVVPFFLGHCLVAHKESRFLFPMIYAFPLLTAWGADALIRWWQPWITSRPGRVAVKILATLNLILLVFFTVRPTEDSILIYRWMTQQGKAGPYQLYTFRQNPYQQRRRQRPLDCQPTSESVAPPRPSSAVTTLPTMHYYATDQVTLVPVDEAADLVKIVHAAVQPVYVFCEGFAIPPELLSPALRWTMATRTFPAWLRHFNINHWQERSRIWNIYRCSLAEPVPGTQNQPTESAPR